MRKRLCFAVTLIALTVGAPAVFAQDGASDNGEETAPETAAADKAEKADTAPASEGSELAPMETASAAPAAAPRVMPAAAIDQRVWAAARVVFRDGPRRLVAAPGT